ncbi:DNA adenine methylase [Paenibacillus sp. FSL K6-1330]|uniref:DNA adenine methylase n=1 Tax=Paenibacillus sp. FSL K6-1330 TaxID=2975292 RepID=UPI0030DCD97D
MSILKSPLRYPGGKTALGPYVEKLIINNELTGCHFYEPFAGGSSISLHLLQRGLVSKVTLIEYDPLIFSFWTCVFQYTDELCDLIEQTEISIETWNNMDKYRGIDVPISTQILELGFAGLFFNRTNFSGIIKAGPIGGQAQESKDKINCRFNKNRIINTINLLSVFRDRVDVKWTDAVNFISNFNKIKTLDKTFLYVDPPYYGQGKSLYRKFFNDQDHIKLSKAITRLSSPWLLSYDNCKFISYLYENQRDNVKQQSLFFDYSAGGTKKEKELLISNLEIPPIEAVKNNPFVVSY